MFNGNRKNDIHCVENFVESGLVLASGSTMKIFRGMTFMKEFLLKLLTHFALESGSVR
jgi:hypothetical protein